MSRLVDFYSGEGRYLKDIWRRTTFFWWVRSVVRRW
jgi:hypothetical protein